MRILSWSAVLVLAAAACGGHAEPPTILEPIPPDPAASLPPLPPAVGPTAVITDAGAMYDQINESDCLTWPSPEAKARGGVLGWERNLTPKTGDQGIVIGESVHCETGEKIVFLQFEKTVVALPERAISYAWVPDDGSGPQFDFQQSGRCDDLRAAVAAAPNEFATERGDKIEDDGDDQATWYRSVIDLEPLCGISVDDKTGDAWFLCELARSEDTAEAEQVYEEWLGVVDKCLDWKFTDHEDDTSATTVWAADFDDPSSAVVSLMFLFEDGLYRTRIMVETDGVSSSSGS